MAVTSIWPIHGRVDKVIDYVRNPEKTTEAGLPELASLHAVEDVVEYAADEMKTERRSYVSCLNCREDTAAAQFMETKRLWGKPGGRVCYHGYQSFKADEVTAETAHEIGVRLAEELWGGRFEVVVATHCNTGHYHNHFVINSVSWADGKKFYNSPADYARMREVSDRLCREYGLSVIENPQRGKSKHYGEWRAEQEGRPTWRGLIKSDVDTAIRRSMTERQFFHALKEMGYEIKTGKDISVRPQGKERFFRLARNLGEGYTIEEIRRRILAQTRPERPASRPEGKRYRLKGSLAKTEKATGFRALYFHYCYLLGIFPKCKPPQHRQLPFSYREDLIRAKELSDEVRLLAKHHIDTAEQLSAFQSGVESQIQEAVSSRKALYRKLRTKPVMQDEEKQAEIKAEISALSGQLKELRREVRLCEDIAVRSQKMRDKMKAAREEEKSQGKEQHDLPEQQKSRN